MPRRPWIPGMMILCISCGAPAPAPENEKTVTVAPAKNAVSVSYDMAAAGLDWLDLVAGGADDETLRAAFFRDVAPTAGCQAIIAHWARFRAWDEAIFYDFILEALDRKATDAPLLDADGHPTRLGHARRLWTAALANREQLRSSLDAMQRIDLRGTALATARRYLPPEADVSNHFHVVLFGASNAFSVGEDNGFDLLQMKTTGDGGIDVDHAVSLFAHEMHHSGLAAVMKLHAAALNDGDTGDRLNLPSVLVAEGMATHFVTPPGPHLESWRRSSDPLERQLAADWDRHEASLPELYAVAEAHIARGLDGELSVGELMEQWLGGMQGPAYAVGADMMRMIDSRLGQDAAVNLARDCRLLLSTYNRAARAAASAGEDAYIFDDDLASRLERFPDESPIKKARGPRTPRRIPVAGML